MAHTRESLPTLLNNLLIAGEHEVVEFKDANDSCSTTDIGKYFSAIANEVNLQGGESGWLIFGINDKTRAVIGTTYREDTGRVVMFEIPAAPRGIPIAWKGHHYARNHESLAGLSLAKQDQIRQQGAAQDWSAVVCPEATMADLDSSALSRAREIFASRYGNRIPEPTIRGWSDAAFLDHAKLTIQGGIARSALLLLGKRESTHHLSPHVAELSWKLEGPERAYEHFYPPFLARRFLPMPDYDLSKPNQVTLHLPGRFIDENYSRLLLAHDDFSLADIFSLDRVQKQLPIPDDAARALRRRGLIEGRKPGFHLSAKLAEATDNKGRYIHHRRQDDAHYRHLILDYLAQFKQASRNDLRDLLLQKLPDVLSTEQKENKIKNLLAALKRDGKIVRDGPPAKTRWRLG